MFASTATAAFWVTYGDPPQQYVMDPAAALDAGDGSLYRTAAGSTAATRLRGGDGTARRTFEHLTTHGDRLYWIESTWECNDVSTYQPDCFIPPGRLVSASASAESLPDEAITVLYESAGAGDASAEGLDLSSVRAIAADDQHVYVLQSDGLHRVPLAGGPASLVTDCATGGYGLAIDDTYLYAIVPAAALSGVRPQSVVRIAKSDGSCQELATIIGIDVTVLNDQVYFVDYISGSCQSGVSRVPRTGGTPELFVASTFGDVRMYSGRNGGLLAGFNDIGLYGPLGGSTIVTLVP